MSPGQPGWSEGFPEKVGGPELVARESRSQPGEEEFQKTEITCKVRETWKKHEVFREQQGKWPGEEQAATGEGQRRKEASKGQMINTLCVLLI